MTGVVACYFLCVLIGYWCRRPIYLGTLDPLKLLSLQEGAWAATVGWLYTQDSLTEDQVVVFALSLSLWWLIWALICKVGAGNYRLSMLILWHRVASLSKYRVGVVSTLYVAAALVFATVSILLGGGGDNRIDIFKLLRPLEGFVTILAPLVFFRLLISKHRLRIFALGALCVMLIISGGKGAIFSLFFPITAAELVGRIRFNKRSIVGAAVFVIAGISISIAANYGATSPSEILSILVNRLLMEGDIYILALANSGLDSVTVTSFPSYIFGPILKALMLPFQVDQNIGSQIASAVGGEEVPTGPNGQWPVLLMAYGLTANWEILSLSIIFFTLSICLKMFLLDPNRTRKSSIAIAFPAGSFVLQFPQTFFADPSYQFVYLVHMIFVAIVLFILFAYSPGKKCPT